MDEPKNSADPTQVAPESEVKTNSEIKAITVRNAHDSGDRVVHKDKSGRFTRANKDLAMAERSNADLKRLLTTRREGKKVTFEHEMAEHLGNKILEATAEDLSGAAKAYEILQTRAWGRPVPSVQERDSLQRQPISVVFIPMQEVKMAEPHVTPTKPSWEIPTIEGEVIQQNPSPLVENPDKDKQ